MTLLGLPRHATENFPLSSDASFRWRRIFPSCGIEAARVDTDLPARLIANSPLCGLRGLVTLGCWPKEFSQFSIFALPLKLPPAHSPSKWLSAIDFELSEYVLLPLKFAISRMLLRRKTPFTLKLPSLTSFASLYLAIPCASSSPPRHSLFRITSPSCCRSTCAE